MKNSPNQNEGHEGSDRPDAELPSGRLSVIPARAFDDARMPERTRAVLGVLGTYSDRDGWCWPGQNTIAKRLAISRTTVRGHLDRLVELGYLQIKERKRPNGSATTNMYRIMFDAELPPAEDRLSTEEPPLQLPCTNTLIRLQSNMPKDIVANPVNMYNTAQSLAKICRMAFDANKGMLMAESKKMQTLPGFTVARMKELYGEGGTWFCQDWRGKKGSPPTPKQIREGWEQMCAIEGADDCVGDFAHA